MRWREKVPASLGGSLTSLGNCIRGKHMHCAPKFDTWLGSFQTTRYDQYAQENDCCLQAGIFVQRVAARPFAMLHLAQRPPQKVSTSIEEEEVAAGRSKYMRLLVGTCSRIWFATRKPNQDIVNRMASYCTRLSKSLVSASSASSMFGHALSQPAHLATESKNSGHPIRISH